MASAYRLTTIAETGTRFADFAPYVAAIDDAGAVVFQARLAAGASGVFRGDGGEPRSLGRCTAVADVISHPAVDAQGRLSYYASLDSGVRVLVLADADGHRIASGRGLDEVGPLGPTMNAAGVVAFRAHVAGRAVIATHGAGQSSVLAMADARGDGFEGLPVINDAGAVGFHVFGGDGSQAIVVHRAGRSNRVIDTTGDLVELGRFPYLAADESVIVCGLSRDGTSAVYQIADGERRRLMVSGAGFASFRGALMARDGALVFYGTPVDGELGIFVGPDPRADRVIGVGDAHGGKKVTGFALNPVSMNDTGQLAIRLELSDGEQRIVRADP